MKAIGAGRKQIRHLYLRTAVLLGTLGALAGAVLGVLLSWALTVILRLLAVRDQRPVQRRSAGARSPALRSG